MGYEVTKLPPHVSGVSGGSPNEVQVFGEVNEALMDDFIRIYAVCLKVRGPFDLVEKQIILMSEIAYGICRETCEESHLQYGEKGC